jgi:uncharacterized protein YprB with RNaseH-like and TPR domain
VLPLHIDLRWAAFKLGYRGTLKEIEPKFGLRRSKATAGIDGFEAIQLWLECKGGSKGALRRLVDYNRADVCNFPMTKTTFARLKKLRAPFLLKARAVTA